MAGEDPEFTRFVRGLPCFAPGECTVRQAGCAHHRTGAGGALRDHDHATIPLCHSDHMDFHSLAGRFKGWTKAQIREWQDEQIERVWKLAMLCMSASWLAERFRVRDSSVADAHLGGDVLDDEVF